MDADENSLEYWKHLATSREEEITQLNAKLKKKTDENLILTNDIKTLREQITLKDKQIFEITHQKEQRNTSLPSSNSLAKLLRKKTAVPENVKPKAPIPPSRVVPPLPPARLMRSSLKVDTQLDSNFLCNIHCYGKEPSMSCLYLARDKPLSEHIQHLCKKFYVAKPWDNYCLQDSSTKHYISSEEFDFPAYYKFNEDRMLSLKLHPTYVASNIVQDLKNANDIAAKKMLLFQLRLKLINEEDYEFGEEFLKKGGAQCLIPQLDVNLPPSFTSLVLTCFSALMGIQSFDWGIVDKEIIDKISNCIASPNTNVQQSALLVMTRVTVHNNNDLLLSVEESLRSVLSSPYFHLVTLLSNGDINTQTNALSLINGIHYAASFCTSEVRHYFEEKFDNEKIFETLKNQLNVKNSSFRRQFHVYQVLRMDAFSDYFIPFSIEYPEHLALLETLWTSAIDEPFESGASDIWTQFGFKTSDALSQLSPTVLYIKNILYIRIKEGDKFKPKVGANLFPIASSSIGITNILCDIFGFSEEIQSEIGDQHTYKMLLNDRLESSFSEINYLVVCLMENAWKLLKSPTIEDLSALFGMMQVTIREVLNEDPETIAQFGIRIKQIVDTMASDSEGGKKKKKIVSNPSPAAKKKSTRRKFKIFKQPLEEIMKNEKLENPSATVPSILNILINSIKTLNGFNLEGIFRISVKMDLLENFKNKLDQGYYDIEFANAHYPAALLKLWLRELATPLIPQNIYQSCVDNAENFEEIQKMLQKIPEVNLLVLTQLARFLHELGQPSNVAKTKMGYPNLSLVFAPAVLTPPDPSARIFNAERERIFVESLIEKL